MKLWILRPRDNFDPNPWDPWYDKVFGFVVRAKTEAQARKIADENAGDENGDYFSLQVHPWLHLDYSTCEILKADGETGLVLRDNWAA